MPAALPSEVNNEASKLAGEAIKLAVLGIFCFGIVLGPIALSKANKAAKLMDQSRGPVEGRGTVTAARITAWVVIVIWVLGIIGNIAGK